MASGSTGTRHVKAAVRVLSVSTVAAIVLLAPQVPSRASSVESLEPKGYLPLVLTYNPPTATPTSTFTPTPTRTPTPTSGPSWNCSGDRYNCSDFSSCAQVMSYWHACPGDPSRLDGDNDGVPCESLCG